MDLTVVIVNWNGGEMLRNCLASLRGAPRRRQIDVIVVDNASRDGSREMAEREFPEFKVLNSGANLGFGKGNNLARPHVRTPLVLFLNPDTVVMGDALDQMAEFLETHPDTGAVGCQMRYEDGSVQDLGIQWFPTPLTEFLQMAVLTSGTRRLVQPLLPTWDPAKSGYVKKLYGGCLMARKELLDEIGWFDDRYFMYAEDVDLCRTIRDHGARLYYLSSAAIVHLVGGVTTNTSHGFQTLMKCESIGKLMAKYYGRLGRWLYIVAILAASHLRLMFVGLCRVVAWATPLGRHTDHRAAWEKCSLHILWCLGIRRPVVKN